MKTITCQLGLSPLKERLFWAHANKTETCWLWEGACNIYGHGVFSLDSEHKGTRTGAHRAAWILTYGEIPVGYVVCHRCDVPACINPEHLFLGTQADNIADKVSKGRQARGETHGQAKLTENQVKTIKKAIVAGYENREISKVFLVSRSLISLIRHNKIWSHVNALP